LGTVGSTEVPDPAGRTKHEVDILVLAPVERPQSAPARIALIGEAKATIQPRGMHDVERLEHIRTRLTELGHHTTDATLALCWPTPRAAHQQPSPSTHHAEKPSPEAARQRRAGSTVTMVWLAPDHARGAVDSADLAVIDVTRGGPVAAELPDAAVRGPGTPTGPGCCCPSRWWWRRSCCGLG
jgi:hypothetical protein